MKFYARYRAGLFLVAVAMCSGCAGTTVYEVAAGYNASRYSPWSQGQQGGFRGGDEVVRFAVRREHENGAFVEFSHLSHLSHGWPVDGRPEDWADVIAVGYRFQLGGQP